MSHLIGLGGYAGSGKDVAADALVDLRGWTKTYMSEPLERALLKLNPIVARRWWGKAVRYRELHAKVGYTESKNNPEVRRLLQVLGTEIGRDMIDPDVWVRVAFNRIDELLAQGKSVALTGIRFANELNAVRERGGELVWIDRGLAPVNTHTSDNTLGPDDFDRVIHNHGSIDDLRRGILAATRREEITQ